MSVERGKRARTGESKCTQPQRDKKNGGEDEEGEDERCGEEAPSQDRTLSFSHFGPSPCSLLFAQFIDEDVSRGGRTGSIGALSSAALTETCYNLQKQKAPLRPVLLLFCGIHAAALHRFLCRIYEQLSHPSSFWILYIKSTFHLRFPQDGKEMTKNQECGLNRGFFTQPGGGTSSAGGRQTHGLTGGGGLWTGDAWTWWDSWGQLWDGWGEKGHLLSSSVL